MVTLGVAVKDDLSIVGIHVRWGGVVSGETRDCVMYIAGGIIWSLGRACWPVLSYDTK
jgi:hypothetical protein